MKTDNIPLALSYLRSVEVWLLKIEYVGDGEAARTNGVRNLSNLADALGFDLIERKKDAA